MARSYANILTSIWDDEDFCNLSPGAQRTYFMLVTQTDITAAGTLPLTLRRWSLTVKPEHRAELPAWVAELEADGFVATDEATEELLVRTFVKHDGGYRNPKRVLAVRSFALAIRSQNLRDVLARELARVGVTDCLPIPDAMPIEGPSKGNQSPFDGARVVVTLGELDSTTHIPQTTTLEPAAQRPAQKRGTRLTDDWRPSDETRKWTLEQITTADAARELEKFRNHWLAKSGRDATKLDWDRTWRNWVLNSRPAGRASPRVSTTDTAVNDALTVAARLTEKETA